MAALSGQAAHFSSAAPKAPRPNRIAAMVHMHHVAQFEIRRNFRAERTSELRQYQYRTVFVHH
jgi:hypothetical protein